MSIRSRLGALASKVATRLHEDRFRPAYDPERLVRAVLQSRMGEASSMPDCIGGRWRDGHTSEALKLLVDYFRTTLAERFFVEVSERRLGGGAVAGEEARWIALACEEVRAMTCDGLAVYGSVAPPLRPGFPWGGEWWTDNQDVLFRARPHRFAFAPQLALAVRG